MSNFLSPVKLDFSSFYKFITSVGLLSIAASIAIPWFALQASPPAAPDNSSAASTIELALNLRADQYRIIISTYPYLSIILLIAGTAITIYGITSWKKRQKLQDEDEEEAFRQRKELGKTTQATPEEREEKLKEEVADIVAEASEQQTMKRSAKPESAKSRPIDASPASSSNKKTSRINVEAINARRKLAKIAEQQTERMVTAAFDLSHSVESGVRTGGKGSPIIDLIARANEPNRWTSFALETRLMTASPLYERNIRDAMLSVAIAAKDVPEGQIQLERVGRPPIVQSVSILVLVVTNEELKPNTVTSKISDTSFIQRVHITISMVNSVLSRKAGVIVLTEEELDKVSISWFRKSVMSVMLSPEVPALSPAVALNR